MIEQSLFNTDDKDKALEIQTEEANKSLGLLVDKYKTAIQNASLYGKTKQEKDKLAQDLSACNARVGTGSGTQEKTTSAPGPGPAQAPAIPVPLTPEEIQEQIEQTYWTDVVNNIKFTKLPTKVEKVVKKDAKPIEKKREISKLEKGIMDFLKLPEVKYVFEKFNTDPKLTIQEKYFKTFEYIYNQILDTIQDKYITGPIEPKEQINFDRLGFLLDDMMKPENKNIVESLKPPGEAVTTQPTVKAVGKRGVPKAELKKSMTQTEIDTYNGKRKILTNEQVQGLLTREGFSTDVINAFLNGTIVPVKNPVLDGANEITNKYIKMKNMLPEEAVKQKMKQAGFSPEEINKFFSTEGYELPEPSGESNAIDVSPGIGALKKSSVDKPVETVSKPLLSLVEVSVQQFVSFFNLKRKTFSFITILDILKKFRSSLNPDTIYNFILNINVKLAILLTNEHEISSLIRILIGLYKMTLSANRQQPFYTLKDIGGILEIGKIQDVKGPKKVMTFFYEALDDSERLIFFNLIKEIYPTFPKDPLTYDKELALLNTVFADIKQIGTFESVKAFKTNFTNLKKEYKAILNMDITFKTDNVNSCIKYVEGKITRYENADKYLNEQITEHDKLSIDLVNFFTVKSEREEYKDTNELVDIILNTINTILKSYYTEKITHEEALRKENRPKIAVKSTSKQKDVIPFRISDGINKRRKSKYKSKRRVKSCKRRSR